MFIKPDYTDGTYDYTDDLFIKYETILSA